MPDRTFLEFMDDPIDWFEEAARLTRLHAEKLAGQGADGAVQKEAADSSAPCSVIVLDHHRRTA